MTDMKVLLFSEAKNTFSRSGVGQALNHQKEALGVNNVEYTLDPTDNYDIIHINTIGLKSWKALKKAKKQGKPVIYHTHTTYEDFKNSIIKSEEKLNEEYFKIDQIRMESLKDAMNEQVVYI